jgi:two-component system sensor histidine kinase UhpB
MTKNLKILLLEDDINDAMLIQMYLKRSDISFELINVAEKKEYIKALEQNKVDVVLSDHSLPQFDSLEALQILNQKNIFIPFILVSGAISEEYAVKILQEGASDYILKDRLQRLPVAIKQSIEKQRIKSEKNKAEQELRKSNERFELAAKASFNVIWDWDPETDNGYFSEVYQQIFGYPSGPNIKIEDWLIHIHPEDKEEIMESFKRFVEGKENRWTNQYRFIKSDGSVAYVSDNAIALRHDNGKPYRIAGVMHDITQIRILEQNLLNQRLLRQKEIAEITIQAQEKERTEIGKELHDNVNQLLATAKILIDSALYNPSIDFPFLEKSRESIVMAIDEVRHISHSLMPPSFRDKNFAEAINEIANNINLIENIHFTVSLPKPEELKYIKEEIKLTIYRIIQEQVSNILKYSKASEVLIELTADTTDLLLTISDNGVGFNTDKKSKGIGLRNISSRAELHSGSMKIISAPGKGTTLKVTIPSLVYDLQPVE